MWNGVLSPLEIEIECVRKGGKWKNRQGNECGNGLKFHIKEMQKIIHPEKKWHKWNEILIDEFCKSRIIGIMGPASSGKTREAADFARMLYYAFPRCTTILVSSTEREMLEMRIWGEIKRYHAEAKDRFPELPGHLISSKQRIITEPDDDAIADKDFRNGICGVPCKRGGNYVGLGSFIGIKNKIVILIADEGQLMPKAYVDAIANLNKNVNFKAIVLGNPKDTTDALGIICEPASEAGGWEGGVDQAGGTKTWKTRFPLGSCIQLVGTDSPNFDVGPNEPIPFPFLIKRTDIEADKAFYGEDSLQFRMMNEGRMQRGQGSRRVLTHHLCEKWNAMAQPIWTDNNQIKIAFLDAAYSAIGGDRCVFGILKFGIGQDGSQQWKQMIALHEISVVPILPNSDESPEEQIARYVKQHCEDNDISPQNFFYDGTGRSSLTLAVSRIWSPLVQSIEFGGKPSTRHVSKEIRVPAEKYYSKFVTELWFSVRLTIESDQFRGITLDIINEGSMREWKMVSGNRIEIETKHEMKKRMGRSPDMFDALCCGLEGARRRGFVIQRTLGIGRSQETSKWIQKLLDRSRNIRDSHSLVRA